ncbi:hypothetical protein BD309DRAFT_966824 [Dichomitus squalens]|uniref:Uncharacterized protein n=1 Tax=Dichomitus squalens TaxID=114155 RepID=A0A4Q9NJG1_9APHY|nr:uncharacterized protein DICSQDRAFT_143001 [Dichomitus squalens LYAD-421 SS1]EJF67486.1 hypothetical protein DICSQDRAFT_143001 [Dichomitus squalens LYAD-421 SS1]TBU25862.1 hypothetical protein BD311DRAFT_470886 [Dichomitus squalens]TBU40705.1 hypothetical protein BD309DRAFT_966824 [Dichomitus squalens]TBU53583.1 hypothetical protein BD310DRAFT_937731 [Dichomitus squalens]
MQLLPKFSPLVLAVLALASGARATPVAADVKVTSDEVNPAAYLVSHEQMMYWIANTDAELTFVGKPINPLTPRSAQDTTVTYCSDRIDDVCGGACTVYTGGATCLDAPDTNCLAATNNVGFCDRSGCGHSCNQLSTCGTRLDNGFCYTPGTASILVSAA